MTVANLMTTGQVADALGLAPLAVRRMAKDGRINPVTKLPGQGGGYLFERAEVERVAGEIAQALKDQLAHLEAKAATP